MNPLDVAYFALAGLTAPWWARKARGGWRERFGHAERLGPGDPRRPRILLHAVSVGEVNALRTLVPLLAPEAEVVVASTTDTGLARARDLFARDARVVRYPLDFSWSVARFLEAVRPDLAALVELEVWPNFVRECARRRIPVAVINGRLSERSFRGYRKVSRFMRRSFSALEFAAVQDADYAARFEAMGVSPENCLVTGSMKWDAAPEPGGAPSPVADALARDFGIDRSRPLVVAGSTGPGEEALLHASCPPGVQLLCAPRKPERFNEAAAALPGCIRRSASRGGGFRESPRSDRFLLDSMGELRDAYCLADVVVVGRSFGDQFGSDPMEPIALGKPAMIGPKVADFAFVVREFERHGGILRTDRDRLGSDLASLLAHPDQGRALVNGGLACIAAHRGASRRHADLLLSPGIRRGPGVGPEVVGAATQVPA
jgi:3-deoxy-D-manno-octulosonic-acid transferase